MTTQHKNEYAAMRAEYARQIVLGAINAKHRTGQWMFNKLPAGIGRVVAGTSFDPFFKELSASEIEQWIEDHLIFDGYEIIGVYHGNQILWEATKMDDSFEHFVGAK